MKAITTILLIILLFVITNTTAANDYYFDAGWRDTQGIISAFERIENILNKDPGARIEVLIHGRDIKLFAEKRTSQHPAILWRSHQLANHINVRFKVCDHALAYRNLLIGDFPNFFSTVYYIPEYIKKLQQKGYRPVELNSLAGKKSIFRANQGLTIETQSE